MRHYNPVSVVAEDYAGNLQTSRVVMLVNTPDVTPPGMTSLDVTPSGTTMRIEAAMSEAGALHYVVQAESTAVRRCRLTSA